MTGEDAFRIASFGLVEDPQAPRQTCHGFARGFFEPTLIPSAWSHVVPRDDDFVVEQTVSDELVAWMRDSPRMFEPANPIYRKTHVNAPGTVRSWFRKMRAADFERAVESTIHGRFFVGIDARPWTLFHTQTVVDRETAAHYLKPGPGSIYFVHGGRVLGKIDDIEWPWRRREWREPLRGLGLTDLSVDDRPRYPIFSSKVPSSSRGITADDLKAFIRDEDERRRLERREAERRRSLCPTCHGEIRFAGAPVGYYGPGACQLLYQYSKLLEADPLYSSQKPDIWLCDTCQIAGFL